MSAAEVREAYQAAPFGLVGFVFVGFVPAVEVATGAVGSGGVGAGGPAGPVRDLGVGFGGRSGQPLGDLGAAFGRPAGQPRGDLAWGPEVAGASRWATWAGVRALLGPMAGCGGRPVAGAPLLLPGLCPLPLRSRVVPVGPPRAWGSAGWLGRRDARRPPVAGPGSGRRRRPGASVRLSVGDGRDWAPVTGAWLRGRDGAGVSAGGGQVVQRRRAAVAGGTVSRQGLNSAAA